ncbi:MAG: hydrogenase nickel incorporation protein HypB [Methylovirgula sp.]
MCTICGCGTASVDHPHDHQHGHTHDHDHAHDHSHDHGHAREHLHDHTHDYEHSEHHDHRYDQGPAALDFGSGPVGVHVPGLAPERIIRIERDILSKNNAYAAENRAKFARNGIFALNFVSSPGSGKTSLLVRTIEDMKSRFPISVIEGDQQTANDALRIRATGISAIQINTGKGCHLDAHMVSLALRGLDLASGGLLFIENVGNLVCPSAFDLGEAHKIVVLSVTEGEDKPLKYPDMFAAAELMLLNKADLLPHLDFNVGQCLANALRVNPRLQTLVVSARTGEGTAAFYAWIEARAALLTEARRALDAQAG